MKYFIVYNNDGEILRTGFCADEDFTLQAREQQFVIEGKAYDENQYVDPVTRTILPRMVMLPLVNEGTISNLPPKTTIIVNGVDRFLVEDGVAELTLRPHSVYEVECFAPKYLDKKVVIET